ncbi:MAG: hypothetical protein H0T92_17200, partial [Pyrinomonadaceae bacterium]|nr:hypothetical protein [Pyrinomonadaceae bacterium]
DKQLAQSESQVPITLPELAEPITKTSGKDNSSASVKDGRKTLETTQHDSNEGVVKLSVSLYNFDIQCLDRIRDFMRKKGVRNLSDSEALRLACRSIEINDTFLDIHQEMQKEDRRRRGKE